MANKEGHRTRKAVWLRVLLGLAIGIGLLIVSSYLLMFHAFYSLADLPLLLRPLPSDEEMITNFQRHRADFERLVQIYREDLSIPTDFILLQPTPQIRNLMSRINVDAVEGDDMVWIPPDPYSKDLSSRKQKADVDHWPQKRKFSGVKLSYAYGEIITYHFNLISKNYYYVPFIPQIAGRTHISCYPYRKLSCGGNPEQLPTKI